MSAIQDRILEWDSGFMGFPVCELTVTSNASEKELPVEIKSKQHEGFKLIYLNVPQQVRVSQQVLKSLGGNLVDHRTTFERSIGGLEEFASQCPPDLKIEKRTDQVSQAYLAALMELAREAGKFSRFNNDPHFPLDKFNELYNTWLLKSLKGELAQTVLVCENKSATPVGFVTVTCRGQMGSIGLIAVAPVARGHGIGTILTMRALQEMKSLGMVSASVVTQRENVGACALYEKCGFSISDEIRRYHFWGNLGD